MKLAVVFVLCFAAVLAAPLDDPKTASIVAYDSENNGVDGYKYSVETSDGKAVIEEGHLKDIGTEKAIVVTGQYVYTAPDGVVYTVKYTADENGFQPQTSHT